MNLGAIWLFCFLGGASLVVVFFVGYLYFGFKHDIYVEKKYPEKTKELVVSPFSEYGRNGFRAMRNLSKAVSLEDTELLKLRKRVRLCINCAVLSFLVGLGFLPLIFFIIAGFMS
jgi:hypothetical protein